MSDERDNRSDQRGPAAADWPGGRSEAAGPGDATAADVSSSPARPADSGDEALRDRAGLAHWISPFERPPLADPSRRAAHLPRMRLEAELDSLRRRAEQLEGHLHQASAARDHAQVAGEEQRVIAIELRTMLDATEYRIGTLEVEVAAREHELGALRAAHVAELLRLRAEREQDAARLAEVQRAVAAEREHFEGRVAALDAEARARDGELDALRIDFARRAAEHEVLSEALAREQLGKADLDARTRELSAQHEQVAWELVATRRRVAELEVAVVAARDAEAAQAAAQVEMAAEVSSLRARLTEQTARVGQLEVDLAEVAQARADDAGQWAVRLAAAEATEAQLQAQLAVATRELEQAQYRVFEGRAAEDLAVSRCAALDEELVAARAAIAAAGARAAAVDNDLARREAELAAARTQAEEAGQVSFALREELAEAGQRLNALQASHDGVLAAADAARYQHASDMDSVRRQLAERAAETERRTADWQQAAERVAVLEQQRAELQERDTHGAALRARLEERVRELEHERGQAVAQLADMRNAFERERLALGQARDEGEQRAAELAADLDAARADLESSTAAARGALAAAAESARALQEQNQLLQSQLAEIEGERERLRQLSDELSSRLGAQGATLAAAESARAGLAEQLLAAGNAREEQAAQLVNAHAQLVLARAQFEGSSAALREAEALCDGLRARIGDVEIALETSRASEGQWREIATEREARLVAAEQLGDAFRVELERAREADGQRAAAQDAAVAALAGERDELLKWLEDEQRAQTELRAQLVAAQDELAGARQEIGNRAELHDAATAHAATLAGRMGELESALRAQQELEGVLRESARANAAELAALREQLATADGTRHELSGRLVSLQAEIEQGAAQAARIQAAAEEAQIQREQARAAQAVLGEECDLLRGAVAQRQGELEALLTEVEELRAAAARRPVLEEEMAQRTEALQVQIAEREQLLRAADDREAALQNAVDELQGQLFKEQSHAAALWSDLESESQFREALDSALAEARARNGELEAALQREQKRRTAHEVAQRESTDEAAELLVRTEMLESRLAEADAERERLQEQVNSLWALKDGLDRECEQLRRKVASSDDWERQRGDATRLQARVDELERLQREAMQRHSAAVSGYMLELNQRSDALRQRDAEMLKASEELSVLQAACDDAVNQLTTVRQERELLELRIRELEAGRPRPRVERPVEAASAPKIEVPPKPTAPLAAREESRRSNAAAAEPASLKLEEAPRIIPHFGEPVVLVHIEDDEGLQDVVRAATAKFEHARYTPLATAGEDHGAGRRLFALNLLARDVDPLTAISEAAVQGREDPAAFTYLASGSRGFVIGPVDFFPHPFEADACASRLLGRPGGLQRLLVVSEDVDTMGGLREVLGRVRCSTAIAFDGRQALDLVPMIKPEVVLVDLSLPRGEALRVVSRLRSDPKTASVGIAMLWTSPLNPKEVAQAAQRALGDYALSHQDLGRALTRVLSESDMGLLAAEAIREAG